MTLFYLKLTITPLLMWAISLASRRWGGLLGGLLSGLPITSALVMTFLCLEQGTAFALGALPGALGGLAAVQATYTVYLLATRTLGIAVAGLAPGNPLMVLGGLIVAGMGASAALPMFWQLPPAFLSNTTQAAGIAMISSFGSIAAFLAPYLIGWMRDATQSASLALYVLAVFIALGGLLVLRTHAAIVNPR